jgi:phage gp16-like protein
MPPVKSDAMRTSELAMIHVAKKALALEDDAYRSILLAVTGKTSSAQLSGQGRKALIDHFKKIGFKVVAKKAGRAKPAVAGPRKRYISKIEAQLATAGRPWAYADAMAKRICNIERIDWCEPADLLKIIAALTYDARRHGRE